MLLHMRYFFIFLYDVIFNNATPGRWIYPTTQWHRRAAEATSLNGELTNTAVMEVILEQENFQAVVNKLKPPMVARLMALTRPASYKGGTVFYVNIHLLYISFTDTWTADDPRWEFVVAGRLNPDGTVYRGNFKSTNNGIYDFSTDAPTPFKINDDLVWLYDPDEPIRTYRLQSNALIRAQISAKCEELYLKNKRPVRTPQPPAPPPPQFNQTHQQQGRMGGRNPTPYVGQPDGGFGAVHPSFGYSKVGQPSQDPRYHRNRDVYGRFTSDVPGTHQRPTFWNDPDLPPPHRQHHWFPWQLPTGVNPIQAVRGFNASRELVKELILKDQRVLEYIQSCTDAVWIHADVIESTLPAYIVVAMQTKIETMSNAPWIALPVHSSYFYGYQPGNVLFNENEVITIPYHLNLNSSVPVERFDVMMQQADVEKYRQFNTMRHFSMMS
jgi:hypothetical protein